MRGWGNPSDLSDTEYAIYQSCGPHPSKAEVQRALDAAQRSDQAQRRAGEAADYRRRHPEATASDFVIGMLADLEAAYAKKKGPS